MAKGQIRSNREKKKPKQDKNKKKGAEAPSPFAGMHSQVKLGTSYSAIRQEALAGGGRGERELGLGVHDFIRLDLSHSCGLGSETDISLRVDRCQNVLCFSPHSLHTYGTRTSP
jgi:hypothetical protein